MSYAFKDIKITEREGKGKRNKSGEKQKISKEHRKGLKKGVKKT